MSTFRDVYQQYVNHSHAQRVSVAQKAAANVLGALKDGGIDDDVTFNFLTNLIKLFVSADRNCTEGECRLFNDVMGTSLTFEQFYNLTNGGSDPAFIQMMDELIDTLPDDIKVDVCTFGLTILAADDTITGAEQALFEKILG